MKKQKPQDDDTIYDYDDRQVSRLIKESKYKEAEKLIKGLLKKYPKSHWLMGCLSTALYEQKKYKASIKPAYDACQIAPNCPLSLWYYASSLDMYGRIKGDEGSIDTAIQVYKGMLSLGLSYLSYVKPCGEGLRWTKAVLNDCRYRLALVYWYRKDFKTAKRWAKLHLRMREQGVKSLYDKRHVQKELKEMEKQGSYIEYFRGDDP
jgi:tetratricopeptide (TPR) repeat protein